MLGTVLQWLVLASVTGVLVGTGVSLFLHALHALTSAPLATTSSSRWLLLPVGGLANGLLLHYGYRLNKSKKSDDIIAAFYDQDGHMAHRPLLIKPLAALVTLFVGGSAGKESPCSHLGAGLASGLGQLLRLNPELQRRLMACGVSAGFASVFGTPIAGALYGVEVLAIGRLRHDFLLPAVVGGLSAYGTSVFWGVPYERYEVSFEPDFSEGLFLKTLLVGLAAGLVAHLYVDACHFSRGAFDELRAQLSVPAPLTPMIGGVALALLTPLAPEDAYGLSLEPMGAALHGDPASTTTLAWKLVLVAITLGSGFYGGVVTPQFVLGALAGNLVGHLVGIDPRVGAAVGVVSVLAAASNTPIAAVILGVELFGGASLLYSAGAAIVAYLLIGHRSIYPGQRLAYAKSTWLELQPDLPVDREKVRLSESLVRWWERRRPFGQIRSEPPSDTIHAPATGSPRAAGEGHGAAEEDVHVER